MAKSKAVTIYRRGN